MANIDQLSYCTTETNVISALPDKPNAVGGLTASQLKAKFDAAAAGIKGYLNDTLVKFMNEKIVAVLNALASTSEGLVAAKHTHANKALLDSYDVETTPTADSEKVVTSGGLYAAIPRVVSGEGVSVEGYTGADGKLTYALSADGEHVVTSVNGNKGDVTGAQAVAGAAIAPSSVDVGGAVTLTETSDGRGVVTVYNASGATRVKAYANSGNSGGMVDVYNGDGKLAAKFYGGNSGYGGAVSFYDTTSDQRAYLGLTTSGAGTLILSDTSGNSYTLTPALIQKLINL